MSHQYQPSYRKEVLKLFRERKISTQRAADLLNISHSEFTQLASKHGIYTSDCQQTNPELVELIFGKNE